MELDILYRLSMMVGFLAAAFLALTIAALAAMVWHFVKASDRELEQLLEDLERKEKNDGGRD